MPYGEHQFANISLAGVRSPRVANKPGETSEQWGEEAKFFVESRLLQRGVTVTILSLPNAPATPFQATSQGAPAPSASIFIGTGMFCCYHIFALLMCRSGPPCRQCCRIPRCSWSRPHRRLARRDARKRWSNGKATSRREGSEREATVSLRQPTTSICGQAK